MKTFRSWLLGGLILGSMSLPARAQHAHLGAGALSPNPGSPLSFPDAGAYNTDSKYVFHSILRTTGPVAGLYDASASVTFTALARDPLYGGPEDGRAADGAQLALEVVSLQGPQGSSWAFWESFQCEDFGDSMTFKLMAGETNGTHRFLLSQNNGLPGEDPYGHCHGRRFTMDKPGLYTVGVRIVDVSHNGPGGGPLHSPSPIYHLYFQADITIAWLTFTNDVITATFATRLGSNYTLEAKSNLIETGLWQTAAGTVLGNNHLQTVPDQTGTRPQQRYYRLRVTKP